MNSAHNFQQANLMETRLLWCHCYGCDDVTATLQGNYKNYFMTSLLWHHWWLFEQQLYFMTSHKSNKYYFILNLEKEIKHKYLFKQYRFNIQNQLTTLTLFLYWDDDIWLCLMVSVNLKFINKKWSNIYLNRSHDFVWPIKSHFTVPSHPSRVT